MNVFCPDKTLAALCHLFVKRDVFLPLLSWHVCPSKGHWCACAGQPLPWQTAGPIAHARRSPVCTGRGCQGSGWRCRWQSRSQERAQCSSGTLSGSGCPRATASETLAFAGGRERGWGGDKRVSRRKSRKKNKRTHLCCTQDRTSRDQRHYRD